MPYPLVAKGPAQTATPNAQSVVLWKVLGWLCILLALVFLAGGCTSWRDYFRNGLKVGPNYVRPPAPVATNWIDEDDKRVREDTVDLSGWWTVFDDPLLNELMLRASDQNLTLREAGFRVLAARAQLGIAVGNFFPQVQNADGGYRRFQAGENFFSQWNFGFNLAWELDFWGRFRRAIQSGEANLDASIFEYDAVLVTLLGDVASTYVQIRTTQRRIELLQNLVYLQEDVLAFIRERLAAGFRGVTEIDRAQASSNLKQSLAQIESLRIDLRIAQNQLCVLLGMPVNDLTELLARAPRTSIPVAPEYVVVGIPADLLRRRPDVRRAERAAATQAELIGIAVSDWYPAITISGNLGWQAASFSDLFSRQSTVAGVGPSFQWNFLNYGRIANNVRLQDARFKELVTAYQNSALQAGLEVENGIVTFLRAQQRAQNLQDSVDEAYVALEVIVAQYEAGLGGVDFNRYALIQQTLVQQQDSWASAQGEIAQGLIQIYRALGGGWQIRFATPPDQRGVLSDPPGRLPAVEEVPPPLDANEMPE